MKSFVEKKAINIKKKKSYASCMVI